MRSSAFYRIISAILIFNMSGIATIPRAIADDPTASIQSINASTEQAARIRTLSRDLIIQFKNPGTLSAREAWVSQGRKPLTKQLRTLQTEFARYKQSLETYLGSTTSPDLALIEADQKVMLIMDYFPVAVAVSAIHAYAKQLPGSAAWNTYTGLTIPNQAFAVISGYDLPKGGMHPGWYLNLLSDPNSPIVLAPSVASPHDSIQMTLSPLLLESIRTQAQNNTPNEQVYFETLKKLILAKLEASDGVSGASSPSVQPQQREALLRQVLADEVDLSTLPQFVSEDLTIALLNPTLTDGKQLNADNVQKVVHAFESAEKARFEEAFVKNLITYPAFLSVENTSVELSKIIAESKHQTLLPAMGYLTSRQTPEVKLAMQKSLQDARDDYAESMQATFSSTLERWISTAQTKIKKSNRNASAKAQSDRIQNILHEFEQLNKIRVSAFSEIEVNPLMLYSVAAGAIQALQPSRAVSNVLGVIMSAPNYELARLALRDVKVATADARDRAQLEAIETILGFGTTAKSEGKTYLSDLAVEEAIKNSYREALVGDKLSNPILSIAVGNPAAPLHEALARLGTDGANSQAGTALVVEALAQSQKHFQIVAQKVRSAQTPADLKGLIVDSGLLDSTLSESNPELRAYHQRMIQQFKAEAADPGSLRTVNGAYSKPLMMMMPIFAAEILAKIFLRKTQPFARGIRGVQQSLMPHIEIYMISVLPLIVLDQFFLVTDARRQGQKSENAEEYFLASQGAQSLYSYWDIQAGKQTTQAVWWGVYASAGMNLAFMGAPFLSRAATRVVLRLQGKWHLSQFEKIGMDSQSILWSKTAIQESAAARLEKISADSTLSAVKKLKLKAQVRSAENSLLSSLSKHESKKAVFLKDFKGEFDQLGIAENNRGFDLNQIDLAYTRMQTLAAQGKISPEALQEAQKSANKITEYVHLEWMDLLGAGAPQTRTALYRQVYGYQLSEAEQKAATAIDEPDYYAILGTRPEADAVELRKAYLMAAQKNHPDKFRDLLETQYGHDPEVLAAKRLEVENRFKDIGQAWGVLGDPLKKAQYDLNLLRRGHRP